MRVLITIPHYFRATGGKAEDGKMHGAVMDAKSRVQALTACIASLHQHFSRTPSVLQHAKQVAEAFIPRETYTIDLVICTAGDFHLLDQVALPRHYWRQEPTASESMLLGFVCHAVLRDRLGHYDYYGYMEDDLVTHDSWLFLKLGWFTSAFGADKVLLPQRYEVGFHPLTDKLYLDGDVLPHWTAAYQDVTRDANLQANMLGRHFLFQRTLNPHSGCFFLTAEQMSLWAGQPYFLDGDTSFIGPLESAASLGVMRTFAVYKPVKENAEFLEIQHHGSGYLDMLRAPLTANF